MTGILPVVWIGFGIATPQVAVILALGLVVMCGVLFWQVKNRITLIVSLIAGLALSLLHFSAPWRTYEQLLHDRDAYVEVEGIVISNRLDEDSLQWLAQDQQAEIRLKRMRISRFESWTDCSGRIMVRQHEDQATALSYGQRVQLAGALRSVRPPSLPGSFDYGQYLKSKGIVHILNVQEIAVLQDDASGWGRWMDWLWTGRDHVLARILGDSSAKTGDHADAENKRTLAAMTLGIRQGMPAEMRTTYIRSGMIHLFAISGLHVGILFFILLQILTLCRLEFRWRHWIAPLLLLLYVIVIGAPASAMRAWLMLSVWSVGRGLRIPSLSINAVLTSALILLLYNPFYLLQGGFQFSFIIVLSLVLGWQIAQRLLHWARVDELLIPSRIRGQGRWWQRLGWTAARALLSMIVAWIGGIGLTAYYNQLFLPLAFLVNIFAIMMAWLVLVLAIIKLAVSFLLPAMVAGWIDFLLDAVLTTLRHLAEVSAGDAGVISVTQPSIAWVTCYYLVLLVLFVIGGHAIHQERKVLSKPKTNNKNPVPAQKYWLTGLSVCLVMLVACMILNRRQPLSKPRLVLLLPPGENVPVIVLERPGLHMRPLLIQAGSRSFGRTMGEWLTMQGVQEIDSVLLLHSAMAFTGGLGSLDEKVGVTQAQLITSDRRGLKALQEVCNNSGIMLREHLGISDFRFENVTIHRQLKGQNGDFSLHLQSPDGWTAVLEGEMQSDGYLRFRGATSRNGKLPEVELQPWQKISVGRELKVWHWQ